jgi:hypothetical protein
VYTVKGPEHDAFGNFAKRTLRWSYVSHALSTCQSMPAALRWIT